MSKDHSEKQRRRAPSARQVGGLLIALVAVLFIAMNRDDASITFGPLQVQTALWVALSASALLGAAVGFLLSRRRYR